MFSYGNSRLRSLYYHCPGTLRECFSFVYSLRQRRHRYGGMFEPFLDELQRNADRTPAEVAADQVARLQRMLDHAGRHVPYYRALFAELRFRPETVTSIADLRRLPLLDKETLRAQPDQLTAVNAAGPKATAHTSGTTGTALHLAHGEAADQRSYACAWFHYGWAGIHRGDRVATLAGHPVADPGRMRPPFWIHDRLERELLFSSQHLAPRTLPLYADALAAFRPAMIRGYPSSVYLLALYVQESGRRDIRPRAVFTSSETLLSRQRQAIEDAFACQAYSFYGNAERAAHLLQCRAGRFHVVTEACVVEVLNPDGSPAAPGDEGELVCTSLVDPVLPLIRYRIGDRGIAPDGPCPCGLGTPALGAVTGRVEDIVVTPDGRHVGRLDHVFKDMLNVREAQIVQEDTSAITVRVVPREGYSPADERTMLAELRLRLGSEIGIRFERVDHIPRASSGKFRFVVSKVPVTVGR